MQKRLSEGPQNIEKFCLCVSSTAKVKFKKQRPSQRASFVEKDEPPCKYISAFMLCALKPKEFSRIIKLSVNCVFKRCVKIIKELGCSYRLYSFSRRSISSGDTPDIDFAGRHQWDMHRSPCTDKPNSGGCFV